MFESFTENIPQQNPDSQNTSLVYDNNPVAVYNLIDDEYDAIRQGVAIRNISFLQLIELSGSDVLDFLHRISTNSLKDLKENKRTGTLFTNEKGRIIDKAAILNLLDKTIVVANTDSSYKLRKWIERYIITENIVVSNAAGKYFLLEILGSQAGSFLMQFAGSLIGSLEDNIFAITSDDLHFRIMKFKEKSGYEKYWVIGDYSELNRAVSFLLNMNNIFNPVMVGEDAFNIFRIEQGMPAFPNEINHNLNPYEINLIDEVCFTKGCYIGQEVIARLDTYDKVQKRMKGVILDTPTELPVPIQLFAGGREDAGIITSKAFSKLIGKQIGLGIINKNYLSGERELHFLNSSHEVKIKLIDLPFKR